MRNHAFCETLAAIDTFSAGDRLPREQVHRDAGFHGMNFAGVVVENPFAARARQQIQPVCPGSRVWRCITT